MVEIVFVIITRQPIRRGTFDNVNDLETTTGPTSTPGTNAPTRSP